jgi:tRNA threonylcarbamoyladenosine biosynthesis protein TsaE
MDVYRLEETDESIGFNDYFNKGGVCIIEWADVIKDKLPEKRLDIKFKLINEDTRVLVFIPYGEEYEEICSAVL